MKKKPPSKKVVLTVSGLAALCLVVLTGAWFLTREPENNFTPASAQNSDTAESWTENEVPASEMPSSTSDITEEPVTIPAESTEKESSSSQTQSILSEDDSGTTSDLSGSTPQEEHIAEAPTEKPSAIGDPTDPETHPEYETPSSEALQPSAPSPDPETAAPAPVEPSAPSAEPDGSAPGTDSDHAGQVYDPVFGWITVGPTYQDTIDSTGDINKQVGTMGGG